MVRSSIFELCYIRYQAPTRLRPKHLPILEPIQHYRCQRSGRRLHKRYTCSVYHHSASFSDFISPSLINFCSAHPHHYHFFSSTNLFCRLSCIKFSCTDNLFLPKLHGYDSYRNFSPSIGKCFRHILSQSSATNCKRRSRPDCLWGFDEHRCCRRSDACLKLQSLLHQIMELSLCLYNVLGIIPS